MGMIRRWIALPALGIIFLAGVGMPSSLLPSVAMADFQQRTLQAEVSPLQRSDGTHGVEPDRGPPGSFFTISGTQFRSFTEVESIKLGGREML